MKKKQAIQNSDFKREKLDRTVIAMPLIETVEELEKKYKEEKKSLRGLSHRKFDIIIDLHLFYPKGREAAKEKVIKEINKLLPASDKGKAMTSKGEARGVKIQKTKWVQQYVFARLSLATIFKLVNRNEEIAEETKAAPPIFKIWPDFKLKAHIDKSLSTVKADAAKISFNALGRNIVWAVMDSGIDQTHPHFQKHKNLELSDPLKHWDFTGFDPVEEPVATDAYGHGTHVAGIIAGELKASEEEPIHIKKRQRDGNGKVKEYIKTSTKKTMSGMAPRCELMSLKVLDGQGRGETSNLIAAMGYIQQINNHGRYLHIHGVNMSVGYDFDPEWFACGQSPLCVEVNRLVRSGVVVVVAAGNTGYGLVQSKARGVISAGFNLTINDPGNADLAITVGSTHRDMPHVYGVSYFSSKGPTGDGRLKPDLVAPGEKIISCAAKKGMEEGEEGFCHYKEDSGTSMAAPHVSGVIAAFLSVRREFINNPDKVKEIFTSTATDLKRERYFQGHGLVDLMRAIQSV